MTCHCHSGNVARNNYGRGLAGACLNAKLEAFVESRLWMKVNCAVSLNQQR